MAHEDDKTEGSTSSLLPPDTAGVDLNWDDDVASARLRSGLPKRPPVGLELDVGDRITAVPELPMSELNAHLLSELDQAKEDGSSPAPEAPTMPGPMASRQHWSSRPTLPPTFAPRPSGSEGTESLEVSAASPRGRAMAEPMLGPKRPLPPEPARRSPSSPRASALSHDELTLDLDDFADGDRSVSQPAAPGSVGAISQAMQPGTQTEKPLATAAPDVLRGQLRDRYAVGDFSGTLESAEQLLALDPGDVDALRYAESCRDVLFQMLNARVGSLDRVLKTAIAPDQIRWLSLNHRAGFLLSLVDGMSTAEELLDISGMSRLEALRILSELLEQRIVAFASPASHE
jgi:hypothetical protein